MRCCLQFQTRGSSSPAGMSPPEGSGGGPQGLQQVPLPMQVSLGHSEPLSAACRFTTGSAHLHGILLALAHTVS